MKCRGFSLIEFCMYLLLVMIIVTISFKWLSTISGTAKKQGALDALIDLHLARDLMVVDIRQGTINPKQWKNEGSRLLWNVADSTVCWECRDEKLFRITGKYQSKTDQWNNKKQAVVAQGITNFSAQLSAGVDDTIHKVVVTISTKQSECVVAAFPLVARKVT